MKKRILVVEDEDKLRRVIELQLVSAGFDVDKAATAEEGLKWRTAPTWCSPISSCPAWMACSFWP